MTDATTGRRRTGGRTTTATADATASTAASDTTSTDVTGVTDVTPTDAGAPGGADATAGGRLAVRKTYKLYVGGAFPRSESGRVYEVRSASGEFLANAAQGSRKDVRDAVVAARAAVAGWSGATAYNRGQVLYRVAEVLEGRRAQFVDEVAAAEGVGRDEAGRLVDASVDRVVWYAGWTDKVAQVLGTLNPVAGPFFNVSAPEPTGVVGVLAPQRSSLLGLVSVLAPVVATGNTAVVVASASRPLPAVTLAEVLATSDVPGGVVNLVTAHTAEVAGWLAAHRDVNAIDLAGAAGAEGVVWGDLEAAAADNLKRVLRPALDGDEAVEPDWALEPGLGRLRAFLETKTVWHPKGI
ncbi:aldehyde dehydrogenase family protein [Terracoccus luteus]|uniref:Aldehyde dehydrogenase family protein n=1 Tax=Terracoccus luteus TaxID=53356 RepID=A0A495XRV0_9MICO|nr:aldehyde dehydrogenase family protein [Terracoccus luteus]RKT77230.1 aldehyde dehydrogenase family protein [Terracoccus luteus]